MKLLFQGDSITDAFRDPAELNPAFQLGNGYVFLIASRLGLEQPGRFHCVNRGISGNGVNELLARWDSDALSLRPNAISLLIGVNETIRAFHGEPSLSETEFENSFRRLVERTLAAAGAPRLIVLEPFLLVTGEVTTEWKSHLQIRQTILRKVCLEFEIPFIETQNVFDAHLSQAPAAYWAYDGIHPTHAGFALLASIWFEKALPYLVHEK
jgi:lysophospholipase L1-like esterase